MNPLKLPSASAKLLKTIWLLFSMCSAQSCEPQNSSRQTGTQCQSSFFFAGTISFAHMHTFVIPTSIDIQRHTTRYIGPVNATRSTMQPGRTCSYAVDVVICRSHMPLGCCCQSWYVDRYRSRSNGNIVHGAPPVAGLSPEFVPFVSHS